MAVVINGTTGITSVNGTAGAPSVTGTDTDTGIVYGTNTLSLATGGTTAVTVDSSQNVGIGTTTAAAGGLLTLNKAPAAAFGSPIFQLGGASFTSGGYYSIGMGFTDATYTEPPAEIAYVATSDSGGTKGAIVFGNRDVTTNTAVTERARIDSSGNLLVGTTTFQGRFTVTATGATTIDCARTETTTSNQIVFRNGNGAVGSIQTTNSTTAYNTSSDYRLKENITPMTGALSKIQLLKPCTYTWKVDGSDGEGFIAHELAEVVPQCVGGEKDAVDADGNPVYQGIDTSFLVATLTAAIQELNAKVEAQAAEIAALKAA